MVSFLKYLAAWKLESQTKIWALQSAGHQSQTNAKKIATSRDFEDSGVPNTVAPHLIGKYESSLATIIAPPI